MCDTVIPLLISPHKFLYKMPHFPACLHLLVIIHNMWSICSPIILTTLIVFATPGNINIHTHLMHLSALVVHVPPSPHLMMQDDKLLLGPPQLQVAKK